MHRIDFPPITRRAFVRAGTSVTASAAFAGFAPVLSVPGTVGPFVRRRGTTMQASSLPNDPDADHIRALLLRAIDAARSAGASYADARAVRIIDQTTTARRGVVLEPDNWSRIPSGDRLPLVDETERHALAVRALVDGAWGFVVSPWWTDDEVVTLARDAVAQARDNAQWTTSTIQLAPAPVATGSWTTPFRIDPFAVPIEEKMELLMQAEMAYRPLYRALDHAESTSFQSLSCQHVTRALATTEGTLVVQHFYTTAFGKRIGEIQNNGLDVRGPHPVWTNHWREQRWFEDVPVPAGTGWETVADLDLWTLGQAALEAAHVQLQQPGQLSAKAIDVGQYTIVMDAASVGRLVDATIGRATDFDRITGIEANRSGTSYLGSDPLQLLGSYSFGSPLLTVTTTRASSAGVVQRLPTVQWDDEGIVPTPFTLVKDGVLRDLPTTRDRAMRLAPYYAKHGRPVVSNGCAMSGDSFGYDLTTVGPPTLVLAPGASSVSWDDMIASVPRGLTLSDARVETDFQCRQLTLTGSMAEIVNGRLGHTVINAVVSIDATQLWKNLTILGGASTARASSGTLIKGTPSQTLPTTVVAVPAVFRDITVISGVRR